MRIKDVDLHSYVMTEKGRTYTALSRIPTSIGHDMQSLIVIGTTVGWMFAVPDSGAKNGYQLTGKSGRLLSKDYLTVYQFF